VIAIGFCLSLASAQFSLMAAASAGDGLPAGVELHAIRTSSIGIAHGRRVRSVIDSLVP